MLLIQEDRSYEIALIFLMPSGRERRMPDKRSRGEVRNGKLQKVAADLFLKRGYDGVTLDKIVEQIGRAHV